MSDLFESTTIGNLQLDNRFVASATWMGTATPDGACTPRLNESMAELARGGVGLIIGGMAHVQAAGHSTHWAMGCNDDSLLPGLSEMTQAVHQAGGKIALQIAHGGLQSRPELVDGTPVGPSPMLTPDGPLGRAMTLDEIRETVDAFGTAADRAMRAGFDGIQIHAAHGYLLNEFLSPFFNKRTDEYGGSLENRARLVLQVVQSIKGAVNGAAPIFIKLNTEDLLPGGCTTDEMLQVSAMLAEAGIDAIELSGGTLLALLMNQPENSPMPVGERRMYWREAAEQYRSQVDVPLMLVGGIRSLEEAEEIVSSGLADYVSMSRPLIREPGLINRWKSGDIAPAECVSCNGCIWAGAEGKGVHCVQAVQ